MHWRRNGWQFTSNLAKQWRLQQVTAFPQTHAGTSLPVSAFCWMLPVPSFSHQHQEAEQGLKEKAVVSAAPEMDTQPFRRCPSFYLLMAKPAVQALPPACPGLMFSICLDSSSSPSCWRDTADPNPCFQSTFLGPTGFSWAPTLRTCQYGHQTSSHRGQIRADAHKGGQKTIPESFSLRLLSETAAMYFL